MNRGRWRTPSAVALVLLVALLVQTAVLARLGLPGGVPDLLVVAVVSIALVAGANTGAVSGFVGGLLWSLVPPGAAPVGLAAGLLALLGFVTGSLLAGPRMRLRDSAALVGLCVAGCAAALGLVAALLGTGPGLVAGLVDVLTRGGYAALLALAVVPAVSLTWRAVDR